MVTIGRSTNRLGASFEDSGPLCASMNRESEEKSSRIPHLATATTASEQES